MPTDALWQHALHLHWLFCTPVDFPHVQSMLLVVTHLQAMVLRDDIGQTFEVLPDDSIVRACCCGRL